MITEYMQHVYLTFSVIIEIMLIRDSLANRKVLQYFDKKPSVLWQKDQVVRAFDFLINFGFKKLIN